MRIAIYTLFILSLSGCLPEQQVAKSEKTDKAPKEKEPTVVLPQYGIKDIWEYVNADGQCAGADERFGDSTNGCVDYFQLVRFHDGTAYFSTNLGHSATVSWHWSEYLPQPSIAPTSGWGAGAPNSLTREIHYGSGIRFKVVINTAADTPTVNIDYDHTLNYSDASSKNLELVEVEL